MTQLERCPSLRLANPGQAPAAVCGELGREISLTTTGKPNTLKKCPLISLQNTVDRHCNIDPAIASNMRERNAENKFDGKPSSLR